MSWAAAKSFCKNIVIPTYNLYSSATAHASGASNCQSAQDAYQMVCSPETQQALMTAEESLQRTQVCLGAANLGLTFYLMHSADVRRMTINKLTTHVDGLQNEAAHLNVEFERAREVLKDQCRELVRICDEPADVWTAHRFLVLSTKIHSHLHTIDAKMGDLLANVNLRSVEAQLHQDESYNGIVQSLFTLLTASLAMAATGRPVNLGGQVATAVNGVAATASIATMGLEIRNVVACNALLVACKELLDEVKTTKQLFTFHKEDFEAESARLADQQLR